VDCEPPSALRPDAEFTGRVYVAAPARLDGTIEGEITAVAGLWIGPDATIRARVSAPEIVVEGYLEGVLHATHRIELRSTARVAAELFTPSLNLQEGAILQGRCTVKRPEDH
jgi:cytoskeletal protein CcmA (bactofilin family)